MQGKKKSKNSDKITGKVRIFSVLFGRSNSLPFFLASSPLQWNKQQQVNNQKTLSDYFFSLMCCLYARPWKSCWGIFWTWLKLLYKKNKQLCRNPCTLCSATSERANPALPTPTYFGFPGITSFQSSSPGTLRLPLSWWKTIPLLDASFCGSFPDLFLEQYLYLTHTTPQYSSDDCSQYFIFFLIAFLLQAFVAETHCSDGEAYKIAGRLSITLQVPGCLLSGKSFLQAGTEPGNLVYLIHTHVCS